jgi:F420-non-reducing hydrogenase iron-sulfur subunit
MKQKETEYKPRILILSTIDCAYPGADTAGQLHLDHHVYTYNLATPSPVVFPEDFFFYCFEQGFDGILIMSCGEECPYPGAYKRLAQRIDNLYKMMKLRDLEIERLRLTAICTVCAQAYIREIEGMVEKLKDLPPIKEVYVKLPQGSESHG